MILYLVAHEGREVARLGHVILREGADAATVVLGALLGRKLHGPEAGLFKLTVRHLTGATVKKKA